MSSRRQRQVGYPLVTSVAYDDSTRETVLASAERAMVDLEETADRLGVTPVWLTMTMDIQVDTDDVRTLAEAEPTTITTFKTLVMHVTAAKLRVSQD